MLPATVIPYLSNCIRFRRKEPGKLINFANKKPIGKVKQNDIRKAAICGDMA